MDIDLHSNMDNNSQVTALPTNTKVTQSEWKTIGVKVRHTELMLLNKHQKTGQLVLEVCSKLLMQD
jgi:hypothetical protein